MPKTNATQPVPSSAKTDFSQPVPTSAKIDFSRRDICVTAGLGVVTSGAANYLAQCALYARACSNSIVWRVVSFFSLSHMACSLVFFPFSYGE